jgi:CD2 antigen cytoplasmic tail-binding protein 2
MFGDMFDEKNKADSNKRESESVQGEPITKKVRFDEGEGQAKEDEVKPETVQWEFKWKQEEDAEIHGPHSTSEMLDWVCYMIISVTWANYYSNIPHIYR